MPMTRRKRNRAAAMWTVCAGLMLALQLAGSAGAQVTGLYYQEVEKDGRIYVFNTPERFRAFTTAGEIHPSIALVGRGQNGETIVAENETAIDLFLFKHNLSAGDRPGTDSLAAPALPQVKLGSTIFLSYQDGRTAGADYSKFVIKRGYLDVTAKLTPSLSARITPDVTQDASGETRLRLKFGYGVVSAAKVGWVTMPYVEFGMVHTPWIDFEEKVDRYRMQDTLFLERAGIMSSADLGIMAVGLLGGTMPEGYQKSVSSAYPGRWGSFAVGIYNGGGYTTSEQNTNKVIEARLSIRPLPDLIPGLQVSCFGVHGKGNTAARPEWTTRMASITFEGRYVNAVGSSLIGGGNSKGDAVDQLGHALERDGWSGFVEGKLLTTWSLIARHDEFTPDTRNASIVTRRTIVGVAYHLGKGNDLLLDYEEITYGGTTTPRDSRTQLTLQLKF